MKWGEFLEHVGGQSIPLKECAVCVVTQECLGLV